jgi:outer membrane lipoprotein-sorting protein
MKYFYLFLLVMSNIAFSQSKSANDILKMVDANISSDNKKFVAKMIVHGRRATRTIESLSWVRGVKSSFTEYLSPPREKGTKMLKLGDQLWLYSPQSDRTIRIAGHMLRQSVMGSDLSYEDMMEDPKLTKMYTAQLEADEAVEGRSCWVLTLLAKKKDVTYQSRKIWVDKERYIILKENRYAKSGKLLKTTDIKKVTKINNRWYPQHIIFKDPLLGGKGTEFFFIEIKFNVEIPEYIFSKAALRR